MLSPDGVAYDWFTNKLYFIDSEVDKIEVVTIKEKYRKVLFWSDLDQPRAIVVVPMKGYAISNNKNKNNFIYNAF